MNNSYLLQRHGQSKANVAGIIISGLADGVRDEYTLTSQGEEEVRFSAENAKELGWLNERVLIFCSPFSRAMKTAAITREVIGIKAEINVDDRLRERWFGDWDKASNTHYNDVWLEDRLNPDHENANVESVNSVSKRMMSLIDDIESQYNGRDILFVSHGDALQILQASLLGDASLHRSLSHFATAEIRPLDVSLVETGKI